LLEAYGFGAVTARDGAHAASVLKDLGPVDAAVLDMTMPGPGPAETLRALRSLAPSLPVLFTSGYGPREVSGELLSAPRTAFLQKPFDTAELVQTLLALLGT
jgi:CheY-like chemotaxis protein